jgi:serine/threonine-protein kinase
VILHELLTGKRLFAGNSDLESIQLIAAASVSAPSLDNDEVPSALDEIVLKALSRDPEDRFSSGEELGTALESLGRAWSRRRISEYVRKLIAHDGKRSGSPRGAAYVRKLIANDDKGSGSARGAATPPASSATVTRIESPAYRRAGRTMRLPKLSSSTALRRGGRLGSSSRSAVVLATILFVVTFTFQRSSSGPRRIDQVAKAPVTSMPASCDLPALSVSAATTTPAGSLQSTAPATPAMSGAGSQDPPVVSQRASQRREEPNGLRRPAKVPVTLRASGHPVVLDPFSIHRPPNGRPAFGAKGRLAQRSPTVSEELIRDPFAAAD